MTVHTVQLRVALAALEVMERTTADPPSEVTQTVVAAARALLSIREAGALIITPDEDGEWPKWAKRTLYEAVETWGFPSKSLDALRDAMPDGGRTDSALETLGRLVWWCAAHNRPLSPGGRCEWWALDGYCQSVEGLIVEKVNGEWPNWLLEGLGRVAFARAVETIKQETGPDV